MRLSIVLFICIATFGLGWKQNSCGKFIKKAAAAVASIGVVVNPHSVMADGAFGNAVSIMKERGPETKTRFENVQTREFNDLNEAGKKRAALKSCKDRDELAASSFGSSIECSQAVLAGDFSIVIGGPPVPKQKTLTKVEEKEALDNKFTADPLFQKIQKKTFEATAVTPYPSAAPTEATPVPEKKYEKVKDLSDLITSGKKRRALAACKNKGTRVFARMGSEGKCTESVMQGNYDRLIEALEYGK